MIVNDTATVYDSIAEEYDDIFSDSNAFYGPISQRERELFETRVPPAELKNCALDIGCGTGFHTEWLVGKGYHTIGVDVSQGMLSVARRKSRRWIPKPRFIRCDALKLSEIGDTTFDVIACLGSTLNHIPNWSGFFWQVSQRLRSGGVFIFSFDSFLGVDTFLLSLTSGNGYAKAERRRRLIDNLQCWRRGLTYRNHWRMKGDKDELELILTYERIKTMRALLEARGIGIDQFEGVHLLQCLNPRVLRASADLRKPDDESQCFPENSETAWGNAFTRIEDWLSRRLYTLSANVVGVGVKRG